MANCPFCKAELSEQELSAGTCGHCQRPFSPADLRAEDQPKDLSDEHRVAQTLDSIGTPSAPQEEEGKKTADERRIAQTLDAIGTPSAPEEKEGK